LASKPHVIKHPTGKSGLDEALISHILRRVTDREGFRFYIAVGEPTEETAVSLADFLTEIKVVDPRSINFHFQRKDFETWIRETLDDAELASRIGRIQKNLQGENLRNEIMRKVKARLTEFEMP